MQPEMLVYDADGLVMRSELYLPSRGAGERAGVLVFPEAFGLNDHVRERAARLADAGYVALAGDLHGDGRVIDNLEDAMELLKPLYADPARIRARAGKAFDALVGRDEVDAARVAAIGFCFGGTMALELGRAGADLKAIVGFHSGLRTQAPRSDAKRIKGKVLVCIGADDPSIDAEQRAGFEAEMRESGCDWQMHLYGNTVHGFTSQEADKRNKPDAVRYSPEADARSWDACMELFGETLAEPA